MQEMLGEWDGFDFPALFGKKSGKLGGACRVGADTGMADDEEAGRMMWMSPPSTVPALVYL